ncbi:MAG: CHAT domain-containing protein, partial [Chloroflexi bacterium]|nr:CHAT domain-containing protein [Chloroflexota bacterium]
MMDLRPANGPRMVLQLSPRDEGLAVRVVSSPVGEAAATDIVLQHIDEVSRMASQPAFHENVGQGLFRSLFPGPLAELYRAAFTQATVAGQTLGIELRFDPDLVRIGRYPWELLHDGTRFLLQAGAVNLARYMTFPEPARPLKPRGPLMVLVVSAHPKDQAPLLSEFETLQTAFQAAISSDKLDLAYLMPPTWDALMDWVLAGAPGVLHFEGHGAFTRTGLLIFEDDDGASDPVDAQTLANAFYGTDLRLAVLSACESSKVAGETLLGSVAPALVLAGIPAVVAMQQSLPDEAAHRFSRGFYQALLAGADIESAVAAGRKQLVRTTYWYVPTLYLRTGQPVGEITRAYLPRRIDTAAPRSAPVNLPLRFGLWLRRPDSPPPTDEELRRLLGLEPGEDVSRTSTGTRMQFPVKHGQLQPGLVDVHLIAPNCKVHGSAVKQMSVFPDFDTPALWFLVTPRTTGRQDIILEITQNGTLIASVAHTLTITTGVEAVPLAAVQSHGQTVGEPDSAPTTVSPDEALGGARPDAPPPPPKDLAPPPAPSYAPPPPAPVPAPAELPDEFDAAEALLDEMWDDLPLEEPEGEPYAAPPTEAPAEPSGDISLDDLRSEALETGEFDLDADLFLADEPDWLRGIGADDSTDDSTGDYGSAEYAPAEDPAPESDWEAEEEYWDLIDRLEANQPARDVPPPPEVPPPPPVPSPAPQRMRKEEREQAESPTVEEKPAPPQQQPAPRPAPT